MKIKHFSTKFAKLFSLVALALLMGPKALLAQAAECGDVSDQTKAINYSLYYESFKNENYADAMPHLRWIIRCAPLYPRGNQVNFERLAQVYQHHADQATDPAVKRTYLDSVLVTHQQMAEALRAGGVQVDPWRMKIMQGRFLQTNAEAFPDRQAEVAQLYREAFESAPDSVDAYTVQYLMADELQKGNKEETLELIEYAETRFADDATMMGYIEQLRPRLWTTAREKYDYLVANMGDNPSEEMIQEIYDLARHPEVDDAEMRARLRPRIAQMNPTARLLRILGQEELAAGNTQEALSYFERAAGMAETNDEKRDIYYQIGVTMQQRGQLSNARQQFRRALEIDPNHGPSLVSIGDLYVSAVSGCGSFDYLDRAVYWLAIDYYERARSRDSSVAGIAAQKIGSYRQYTPTQEMIFFRNLKSGQRQNISGGCYGWIGESTTIR